MRSSCGLRVRQSWVRGADWPHWTSILPLLHKTSVCTCLYFPCVRMCHLCLFSSAASFPLGLFRCRFFGHRSECRICPTQPMPASPPSKKPKGPGLRCVFTWSAKLQTDASLYSRPGPSSFPTLKWEFLHLAHSNVITVWLRWDPNAEAGSVLLAPYELHTSFPLFLSSEHDLRHSLGHQGCSNRPEML